MISDDRPQTIIVLIMIVLGAVGGFGLVSSASYYSGSYAMVQYLDIDLVEVRVSNINTTDAIENPPGISFVFQFTVPNTAEGKASISFLRVANVFVNGESIQYTSFTRSIPQDSKDLYPNYDKVFSVGSTVADPNDQDILFNASDSGSWTFSLNLIIFYQPFDARADSVRVAVFSHQGVTEV